MKFSRIKVIQYFPRPFRSFGGNINVKVDFSNYATKTDLKNVTHVDTSNFCTKSNFSQSKNWSWSIRHWQTSISPCHFSKLSDVVKNDVVEKIVFDKLAAKVNNIDTCDFVLKIKYQTDKAELEKKFLV